MLLPSERGGLFSLHSHPWYLPIDSYRRNKSNSISISIHVSFLQWFCFLFLIYCTAPSYQHYQPMKYLESCVTSLKWNCIKAESHCTSTCWGTVHLVHLNFWALSALKTGPDWTVTGLTATVLIENSFNSSTPNKITFPPLGSSDSWGRQFITSDKVFPKSY